MNINDFIQHAANADELLFGNGGSPISVDLSHAPSTLWNDDIAALAKAENATFFAYASATAYFYDDDEKVLCVNAGQGKVINFGLSLEHFIAMLVPVFEHDSGFAKKYFSRLTADAIGPDHTLLEKIYTAPKKSFTWNGSKLLMGDECKWAKQFDDSGWYQDVFESKLTRVEGQTPFTQFFVLGGRAVYDDQAVYFTRLDEPTLTVYRCTEMGIRAVTSFADFVKESTLKPKK